MKNLRIIALAALSLIAAVLALNSFVARAHEERTVGKYTVALGWRAEPAVTGLANGPDVYIGFSDPKDAGSDPQKALEALKVDLSVEVSFGPAKKTLRLYPHDPYFSNGEGAPSINLVADLIPTRPGDYTFHLTGTIGDQKVDETYTSADKKFSTVDPASDILFPDTSADVTALQERVKALEAAVADLKNIKK